MSKAQISMWEEKIVDSFAGGGGASTGIELATGRVVDVAINHDPDAILMHKTNHPHTTHYQASVWDVDPLEVTGGSPVGLLWACCGPPLIASTFPRPRAESRWTRIYAAWPGSSCGGPEPCAPG